MSSDGLIEMRDVKLVLYQYSVLLYGGFTVVVSGGFVGSG